ncbi:hypothetical protein EON82_22300 [bacterium]|nr:MAG: hypothetical protein EON82_22300 [bacterium]
MGDLDIDLAGARTRNAARRGLRSVLDALSVQDRRNLLLEALAEVDEELGQARRLSAHAHHVSTPESVHFLTATEEGERENMTLTRRLVNLISHSPGVGVTELARHLYGDESRSSRAKVRSLLSMLHARGVIEKRADVDP